MSEEMWESLTRDYPPATAAPCNDCPWRRNAKPGWLGPHTAEEWIAQVHSDTPIACHKTILETDGLGYGDWEHPAMRQCRGAAIFRRNVAKTPKNPNITTGPEDEEHVFATNQEFIDYHTRGGPGMEIEINVCGDRKAIAHELDRMAMEIREGRSMPDWYIEGNGSDQPNVAIHTEHTEDGDPPLVESNVRQA